MGMSVQVGVAGGGPHSKLVGQLGPYSGHSSQSNMYAPLKPTTAPHSVASLQMV